MEMRAKENISIGQDLTPPISPLSLSLHHSCLLSHCSSCFSPLPPPFSPSLNSSPFIRYCSLQCSSLDSPLHLSSSEFHFFHLFPLPLYSSSEFPTSADLRLSLRLLHHLTPDTNGSFRRIGGLITNFEKFMFLEDHSDDNDDELSGRIRDGAKAMAVARRMRDGLATNRELSAEEYALEAAVLCLVLTNAVEVQDNDGKSLGVGVYDVAFSYINHSCSPNASYRFSTVSGSDEFRIFTVSGGTETQSITDGDIYKSMLMIGSETYGPRIIVRSIKAIRKGEEVLITYTDLLQPKVMRQRELWSKYRFSCCCKRCKAIPTASIDHCLQEILILNVNSSNMALDGNAYADQVMEKLLDCLNDGIDEFLSCSNPMSCCTKLEILLTQHNIDLALKPNGENLRLLVRLDPLHHVSLHAYMTLTSAYKVSASDLLALHPETDKHQTEAFTMSKKSAAYSLLLAGATHHLFESESSLIVPLSTFWTTAGETLLTLISHFSCQRCDKCQLLGKFRDNFVYSHDENEEFAEITRQFLNCVSSITPKIWGFLIESGGYLKIVEDPINFRNTSFSDFAMQTDSGFEAGQYRVEMRVNLFQLGVHCLLYGAFLSTVCFGHHCVLMSKVEHFLSRKGILNGKPVVA